MEKEYSNKRKSITKCDTCSQKTVCEEWRRHKKIIRYTKYLKYIIFVIGFIIILGVLISGCDNLKCYPEFDLNGKYIGIKCGGKF